MQGGNGTSLFRLSRCLSIRSPRISSHIPRRIKKARFYRRYDPDTTAGGVAELECPESLEVTLVEEVECVAVVPAAEVIVTAADVPAEDPVPLVVEDDADASEPPVPLLLELPLLASSLLYWPE